MISRQATGLGFLRNRKTQDLPITGWILVAETCIHTVHTVFCRLDLGDVLGSVAFMCATLQKKVGSVVRDDSFSLICE